MCVNSIENHMTIVYDIIASKDGGAGTQTGKFACFSAVTTVFHFLYTACVAHQLSESEGL